GSEPHRDKRARSDLSSMTSDNICHIKSIDEGMQAKSCGRYKTPCAKLKSLQRRARVDEQPLEPGVHEDAPHNARPMHRSPEQLPDPWLFDSEKLLCELDRCRELVLTIPAPTHEAHFAVNTAITAIWNLSEQLRYLLN